MLVCVWQVVLVNIVLISSILLFHPASCSNLTHVNGAVVYTTMRFPILAGAVATHSCSDGYLLSGVMNRTCMTRPIGGGVWGGDALMCRGE